MKKILAGLLVVACTSAQADFINGNGLLQRMNSTSEIEKAFALGYVTGVSDITQNSVHCSSAHVTTGQSRDVVKKFLDENPAVRDAGAALLVSVALARAFPCPEKQKGKNS